MLKYDCDLHMNNAIDMKYISIEYSSIPNADFPPYI